MNLTVEADDGGVLVETTVYACTECGTLATCDSTKHITGQVEDHPYERFYMEPECPCGSDVFKRKRVIEVKN